jgi:hypothetical protein
VGRGGALGALARGWEAAATAVDGELRQRRCSGGVWWSGKRNSVEMRLCERKRESVGLSRMCLRPRRRHGRGRAGAGGRRGAWWLGQRRRDVERQKQASAGRGSGGAGAGAARGAKRGGAGAVGVRHMAGEGGGASGREETEQRGWR